MWQLNLRKKDDDIMTPDSNFLGWVRTRSYAYVYNLFQITGIPSGNERWLAGKSPNYLEVCSMLCIL